MTQVAGTTDTFDLIGMAEDIEDTIWNISPEETPFYSGISRIKAVATNHQWQTDSLAAASSNKQVEGDDATFTTAVATTMLSNRMQILRKTVINSDTADAVKLYGRKETFAYSLMKRGKELKRDIEFMLLSNQASSVGGSQTARQSAGVESMITNRTIPSGDTVGTTPGYAGGDWTAPTDGTAGAIDETLLVSGIISAWSAGGDPAVLMMNAGLKRKMAAFGGASKFAGVSVNQGRTTQGVVIGGVDLYISDVGEHKVVLNRHVRATTLLGLDMQYWASAWLRPIKYEALAKTGDATKGMLICEGGLVGRNPASSFKLMDMN